MAANRVIRNWTDSYRVERLSDRAEVFFTRLIMTADDFGIYHAEAPMLKAHLYPVRKRVKEKDIPALLAECVAADLIGTFTSAGRAYLYIYNFGQRLRTTVKRFPDPPPSIYEFEQKLRAAGNCPQAGGNPPPEVKGSRSELETGREGEMPQAATPPGKSLKDTFPERMQKFYNDLKPYTEKYPPEMLRAFFNYWSEKNKSVTKMRWELQAVFEISKRLATWARKDDVFTKNQKNESQDGRRRQSQ